MKNIDISKDELINLIDQWIIGRHAERNRQILKRRLIDGICYEPLAEEFDISVRTAYNIVNKGMQTLTKHI